LEINPTTPRAYLGLNIIAEKEKNTMALSLRRAGEEALCSRLSFIISNDAITA
jgi:hypothetical protein